MNTPLRPEKPPAESGEEVAPPPLTPSPVSTAPTIAFAGTPRANRDLSGEFGKHTIRRPIGKGGMGRVYLAHDSHLDREVALEVPASSRVSRRRQSPRTSRAPPRRGSSGLQTVSMTTTGNPAWCRCSRTREPIRPRPQRTKGRSIRPRGQHVRSMRASESILRSDEGTAQPWGIGDIPPRH